MHNKQKEGTIEMLDVFPPENLAEVSWNPVYKMYSSKYEEPQSLGQRVRLNNNQ